MIPTHITVPLEQRGSTQNPPPQQPTNDASIRALQPLNQLVWCLLSQGWWPGITADASLLPPIAQPPPGTVAGVRLFGNSTFAWAIGMQPLTGVPPGPLAPLPDPQRAMHEAHVCMQTRQLPDGMALVRHKMLAMAQTGQLGGGAGMHVAAAASGGHNNTAAPGTFKPTPQQQAAPPPQLQDALKAWASGKPIPAPLQAAIKAWASDTNISTPLQEALKMWAAGKPIPAQQREVLLACGDTPPPALGAPALDTAVAPALSAPVSGAQQQHVAPVAGVPGVVRGGMVPTSGGTVPTSGGMVPASGVPTSGSSVVHPTPSTVHQAATDIATPPPPIQAAMKAWASGKPMPPQMQEIMATWVDGGKPTAGVSSRQQGVSAGMLPQQRPAVMSQQQQPADSLPQQQQGVVYGAPVPQAIPQTIPQATPQAIPPAHVQKAIAVWAAGQPIPKPMQEELTAWMAANGPQQQQQQQQQQQEGASPSASQSQASLAAWAAGKALPSSVQAAAAAAALGNANKTSSKSTASPRMIQETRRIALLVSPTLQPTKSSDAPQPPQQPPEQGSATGPTPSLAVGVPFVQPINSGIPRGEISAPSSAPSSRAPSAAQDGGPAAQSTAAAPKQASSGGVRRSRRIKMQERLGLRAPVNSPYGKAVCTNPKAVEMAIALASQKDAEGNEAAEPTASPVVLPPGWGLSPQVGVPQLGIPQLNMPQLNMPQLDAPANVLPPHLMLWTPDNSTQ